MGDLTLKIEASDDSDVARSIHENLRLHVEAEVGAAGRLPVVISFSRSSGEVVAGLRGFSHWGWLYISHLWVQDSVRGARLGQKLMAAAEKEARSRICHGIYVDTFSSGARRFYLKQGFDEVGKIVDFPPGHTRFYLKKLLD